MPCDEVKYIIRTRGIFSIARTTTANRPNKISVTEFHVGLMTSEALRAKADRRGSDAIHSSFKSTCRFLSPLDEAVASRAAFVIVSWSDERTDVRTGGNAFGTS